MVTFLNFNLLIFILFFPYLFIFFIHTISSFLFFFYPSFFSSTHVPLLFSFFPSFLFFPYHFLQTPEHTRVLSLSLSLSFLLPLHPNQREYQSSLFLSFFLSLINRDHQWMTRPLHHHSFSSPQWLKWVRFALFLFFFFFVFFVFSFSCSDLISFKIVM